jgi:hypothetical protein
LLNHGGLLPYPARRLAAARQRKQLLHLHGHLVAAQVGVVAYRALPVNSLLQGILVERNGRVVDETALYRQRLLRRDVVALGQQLQVVQYKALFGIGQSQAHRIGRSRAGHHGRLGVGRYAESQA